MTNHFDPPLDQLFRLGAVQAKDPWLNYLALGLGKEHVADLIHIATDLDLNWADENSLEVWAPLHAWRALSQLRAREALQPLISMIDELDKDEWFTQDLPAIMVGFGAEAVAPFTIYLGTANLTHWSSGKATVIEGMALIGKKYPEMRGLLVETLTHHLRNYANNEDGINAWLIDSLLNLRAKKVLPVIAAAYAAEKVDEMFVAWDHVQKMLQLLPQSQPIDFL